MQLFHTSLCNYQKLLIIIMFLFVKVSFGPQLRASVSMLVAPRLNSENHSTAVDFAGAKSEWSFSSQAFVLSVFLSPKNNAASTHEIPFSHFFNINTSILAKNTYINI